jgi:hypothetical protein
MIQMALKCRRFSIRLLYKRLFSEMNTNHNEDENEDEDNDIQEKKRLKLKHILDSSKLNHKAEILSQESLKDAHIYCKINNLTGQESGPLLENYIKNKYNMEKNEPSSCTGDLNCNQQNIEIKISNGGKDNKKFNYVQLRMNHKCDYIFTAYYLDYINLNQTGELFIFRLNKEEIKKLIIKYGSYAHGTIKKLGKISKNDLDKHNNDKEYALRPKYGDKCWNDLLRFRIDDVV